MLTDHGSESTAGEGFKARLQALDTAASALPGPAFTLDDVRRAVTGDRVRAEAFGRVEASAQVKALHERILDGAAAGFSSAYKWLKEMQKEISACSRSYLLWDRENVKNQRDVCEALVTTADADERVGTGAWGRGGAYLDGDQISLRPRDPDVPSVSVPNNVGAKGFIVGPAWDIFSPDHTYNKSTATSIPFDTAKDIIAKEIANNPVPWWGDQPASPSGTRNDAGFGNYVHSYTVKSPDPDRYTDITVNYTIAGDHMLHEGYVIRYGERNADGTTTLVSYGEGNGWIQSPLFPTNSLIFEPAWWVNQQRIIYDIERRLPPTR